MLMAPLRVDTVTFRTRLYLESGDRDALQGVVHDIRSTVERKGAELKGPHSHPPSTLHVPQHKGLEVEDRFPAWQYTVYSRELEIVGRDDLAREIAEREFPDSIHVEAEIDPVSPAGN
jgi:ribosomal protein S10